LKLNRSPLAGAETEPTKGTTGSGVASDVLIDVGPCRGPGLLAAAIATIVGVVLIAVALIVELTPCSGFAIALIGLAVICFGIAIAVSLPGSWVFPLSKDNYRVASELGVDAFIPFKSNSVNRSGTQGSPPSWRKAFYMFQANRDEFDRNYHRRSNVESVFSALKRKFGENIRSRTHVAQVNEILCKLIAYNLTVVVHEMFENGIAPSFVKQNQGA